MTVRPFAAAGAPLPAGYGLIAVLALEVGEEDGDGDGEDEADAHWVVHGIRLEFRRFGRWVCGAFGVRLLGE